jgi:uncharacterized paraquat-inducible protein A
MQTLATQRCHFHLDREAVARCPECGQFFCRECVTEHDDRVVCASCLKKIAGKTAVRRARFAGFFRAVLMLCGILILWMFFYYIGRLLLATPASFHEGTLWSRGFFTTDD